MRNSSSTFSYQARRPGMLMTPLASIPLIRPAHQILGWTAAQKAVFCVDRDTNNLACAELAYAGARAALGAANRMKSMRRYWQAKAMTGLNVARGALRRARLALATSLAAPALVLAAA